MTTNSVDIVIIGAGLAGISAALQLKRIGVSNFIVLESRDCIGGRIRSISFDGSSYPVGPIWLHGKNNNPLYHLAKFYGLSVNRSDTTDFVIRSENGEDLLQRAKELFAKLSDITNKVLEDLRNKQKKGQVVEERSCGEVWRENGWNPKDPLELSIDCFWFDLEYGVTSDNMSLLGWYKLDKVYEGDDEFFQDYIIGHQNGFLELITAMKNDAFQDNDKYLRLNCVVEQITTHSPKYVEVRTTTGDIYSAKQCILTVSNSVLCANKLTFIPPLPEEKLKALNRLSCINLCKVYVKFSETIKPFWDTAPTILYASGQRGYFTKWLNLSAWKIAPENANILMAELIGDGLTAVKNLSRQELYDEVTSVLSKMYPTNFVAPLSVKFAEVNSDPFAHGAFPGIHMPLDELTMKWAEKSIGPILFAGDGATIDYLGCTQGAYLTGIWRANEAADAIVENE